jgi:uncharacterized protein (DUF2267 family)
MLDTINELASKSGISMDEAKKGLGAVLSTLKEKLPADAFAQVQSAVPGSEGMMAAGAGQEPAAGGGVVGAIKGMAEKLFGGGAGAVPALMAKLQGLGLSADQIQKFLPNVLEFLKGKLPEGAMKQVSALLPAGGEGGK